MTEGKPLRRAVKGRKRGTSARPPKGRRYAA